MKLAPVEPFSKAAPGFNKDVARQVYDAIMSCPDDESAAVMTRCIAFDVITRDMTLHGEQIAKATREWKEQRTADVKSALVKQYLARRMGGKDVAEIAKAAGYLALLAKDYSTDERSRNATRQRRGASGRFVTEHTRIQYDRKQPVDHQVFSRIYGLPTGEGLRPHIGGREGSDQEIRNYQLAYQQIADLVGPYSSHPGALVHIRYPNHERQITPNRLNDVLLNSRQRPISAAVSVNDHADVGPAPDFFHMMGGGPTGARVQSTVATPQQWQQSGLNPDRLRSYNDAIDRGPEARYQHQPGAGLFHRLATGSTLLQDTLGDQAPSSLKAALAAGNWVGQYGPEAQRVVGPSVQRTAYRYRGVEKKPENVVLQRFRNTAGNSPTPEELNQRIIGGQENEKGEPQASPLVSYMRQRWLPDQNLNTLQRMSGTIPPSQGVLIDKKGNILSQAHGYGDDWYLPFNLKNISKLRGGQYVRTRTYGGPTTEDIYAGLISGAHSLTVVSHNGVYNIEFDPSFKGGRRYNDKAARMVARYGQLLDAAGSGQVRAGMIAPSRFRELQDKAKREIGPDDPKAVQRRTNELVENEREDPKLSDEQKEQLKRQILEEAAEKHSTASGRGLTLDEMRSQRANQLLRTLDPENKLDRTNPGFQNRMRQEITNDGMLDSLNLRGKYERAERKAEAELKTNLSPLSLNGEGYNKSMRALKEQFPYYIRDVKYLPWETIGDGKDTGYVKPQHIRPHDAWVGFFGEGLPDKIHADSQFRVTPSTVKLRSAEPAEQTQRSSTTSTGPVRREGSNSFLAAESTKEMAQEVRDVVRNGTFADHAHEDLRGRAASEGHDWLLDHNESPGIAPIANMTDDEIDDALARDPEGFRRKVDRAVRDASRMFSFDRNKVRDFHNRGAMPEPRALNRDDPSAALLSPNEEYALGARFEPGPHTREALDATAADDDDITLLGLPHPSSEEYSTAAREKANELSRQNRELQRRFQVGSANQGDLNQMKRQIMGLVKANHLHRRYSELPAAEVVEPDQIHERVIVTTQDDPRLSAHAVSVADAALGGTRPAIENTQNSSAEDELLRRNRTYT